MAGPLGVALLVWPLACALLLTIRWAGARPPQPHPPEDTVTTEQLALDCEPDWDDDFDEEYDDPPRLPADLLGQGLPYDARLTDIPLTGSYL